LSKAEYLAQSPSITHAAMEHVYHHFDRDHDGCIGVLDMQAEYHVIDTDGKSELLSSFKVQYLTTTATVFYMLV